MQTSSTTRRATDGQVGRGSSAARGVERLDVRRAQPGHRPGAHEARRATSAAALAPLPPKTRSSASASVRDSSKSARAKSANVSACLSAPITAESAEASSSTSTTCDQDQLLTRERQAPHRREQTAPALWAKAHRGRHYSAARCASRSSPSSSCSSRSRAHWRTPPRCREAAAWMVVAPGRGGVLLQHSPRREARDRLAHEAHDGASRAALRAARRPSAWRAATRSRSASRACRSSSASARPCGALLAALIVHSANDASIVLAHVDDAAARGAGRRGAGGAASSAARCRAIPWRASSCS